ncbi:MAG: TetR/AcrR family transcriptional regulator [Gluconobacter potus]
MTLRSIIAICHSMARPKAFDRGAALAAATKTFATYGYEGTSTEALVKSMGIGRQSMYDTFGDKRALYLEALQHYCFESVGQIAVTLQATGSPLTAIEAALLGFAARIQDDSMCLGVGSVCEFGRRDREVTAIGKSSAASMQNIFAATIQRGKDLGEIPPEIDPKNAARFINATFIGLKVMARGGATHDELRATARMALRCLA